jgi:hypothetical protein
VSNGGGKLLTVAEFFFTVALKNLTVVGIFDCGTKEFNCGGAATLNGPWRTLNYISFTTKENNGGVHLFVCHLK